MSIVKLIRSSDFVEGFSQQGSCSDSILFGAVVDSPIAEPVAGDEFAVAGWQGFGGFTWTPGEEFTLNGLIDRNNSGPLYEDNSFSGSFQQTGTGSSASYTEKRWTAVSSPHLWGEIAMWFPTEYHIRDRNSDGDTTSDTQRFTWQWTFGQSLQSGASGQKSWLLQRNRPDVWQIFYSGHSKAFGSSPDWTFVQSIPTNQWNFIRFEMLSSSAKGASDGILRIKFNDTTILNQTNVLNFIDTSGNNREWGSGTSLGFWNSGVTSTVDMRIGQIHYFTSTPGWVW